MTADSAAPQIVQRPQVGLEPQQKHLNTDFFLQNFDKHRKIQVKRKNFL